MSTLENIFRLIFQVCDIKEDQYYCLDDAVKYLQTRKATQRKNCKLLYTHSKEEISTIIKNVNNRLQEDSDSESDTDDESGQISTKRISELDKEDPKNQSFSGDLKRHNKSEKSGNFSPPPAAASTSTGNPVGRPRLSGPNVAPGTAISVNSFSMVRIFIFLILTLQSDPSKICLIFPYFDIFDRK